MFFTNIIVVWYTNELYFSVKNPQKYLIKNAAWTGIPH